MSVTLWPQCTSTSECSGNESCKSTRVVLVQQNGLSRTVSDMNREGPVNRDNHTTQWHPVTHVHQRLNRLPHWRNVESATARAAAISPQLEYAYSLKQEAICHSISAWTVSMLVIACNCIFYTWSRGVSSCSSLGWPHPTSVFGGQEFRIT